MDPKMFRDRSRISARKSYRICPMCHGKGYFDDNSLFKSRPSLHCSSRSTTAGIDEDKRDSMGKGDEYEIECRQTGNISLASSVPQLPVLRSQGGSIKCKKLQDQGRISSTILPSKFNQIQRRRSYERLNYSSYSPRKSMSRIRSFGSETSVNSDASDLLDTDRDLGNPREALRQARIKMKSNDWDVAMSGLEDIAVLSAQMPEGWRQSKIDVLDNTSCSSTSVSLSSDVLDWDAVGTAMAKLVASFHVQKTRSVRLTCQILREMFKVMTTSVHRPQFDDAVNELIKRTADTSRMVRWDAHQALDSMIKHVPVQFSTRAVLSQAPRHKNAVIRQTAMRLTHATVESVTPQVLLNSSQMRESRKQIINTLCRLIDDPNQHVRWLVRQTLQILMAEDSFEDILNNEAESHLLKKADRSLVLLQYNSDVG